MIANGSYAIGRDFTNIDSNTVLEQQINVTNPKTLKRVRLVIEDTIVMLNELDAGDKLGSVSWANSFTISSAIEKLKLFLTKPESGLTKKKIIDYNETMIEYFETYILADLNPKGVVFYNELKSRQKAIIAITTTITNDEKDSADSD